MIEWIQKAYGVMMNLKHSYNKENYIQWTILLLEYSYILGEAYTCSSQQAMIDMCKDYTNTPHASVSCPDPNQCLTCHPLKLASRNLTGSSTFKPGKYFNESLQSEKTLFLGGVCAQDCMHMWEI